MHKRRQDGKTEKSLHFVYFRVGWVESAEISTATHFGTKNENVNVRMSVCVCVAMALSV